MWNAQQQVINLRDVCKYRATAPGKRKIPQSLKGVTPVPKSNRDNMGRAPMSIESKSMEKRLALKDAQAAIRGAKIGPYRDRVSSVSSVGSSLPSRFSDLSLTKSPQIPSPPGTKSTDKNHTPRTPLGRSPYVPAKPKPIPLNWKRGGLRRRTMVPIEQEQPQSSPPRTPQDQVISPYVPTPLSRPPTPPTRSPTPPTPLPPTPPTPPTPLPPTPPTPLPPTPPTPLPPLNTPPSEGSSL